jgi:GNAT superfamily N-acetyltransferase
LASSVADALAEYRAFAAPGWEPPGRETQADGLRAWIANPHGWGEIALDDGDLAGHVTTAPAASHPFAPLADTAVVHLGHLFVLPGYWGSGLAGELLAHATHAAAARGFSVMRLFSPLGQVRARRFYEREGFVAVGEPFEVRSRPVCPRVPPSAVSVTRFILP